MTWIWYIVLSIILILFVALHVVILPAKLLRLQYRAQMNDRGLKNINEVDGHSIIYAPDSCYRKYLRHYALSKRNGELNLICDFANDVQYADFDVSIYDGKGQVIKVFQVKQIVEDGVSEPILLPENTAYVSVKLNHANNEKFAWKRISGVSNGSLVLFLLISSFLELAVLFLLKVCFSYLFGGIFGESFLVDASGNIFTIIVGLIVIVLNNLVTILVIKIRNATSTKRGIQ